MNAPTPSASPLPPVVDIRTFLDLLAAPGTCLLDVRWALDGTKGEHTYRAGHVPGAVYVDLPTQLAAPARPEAGRHPLPAPEDFAVSMARAGVSDGDTVLVYDDTDGSQASRLVWMLRALGQDAALLDGGLAAYVETTGATLQAGAVTPDPGRFTPRPWGPEVIATADEVAAAAASEGATVVDARAGERYRGETEPIDPRAGHVPGAVNVPFSGNLGADGRFLDPAALRERFGRVGADPDGEVIVYCGSGVTATHDVLALQRAGFTHVRLFPGSWSQWSADASRGVATGA